MLVSSINAASATTQTYPVAKSQASKATTTVAGPTDADGDHDGDTAASDSNGLDVRG
jgi:hypothetical protein